MKKYFPVVVGMVLFVPGLSVAQTYVDVRKSIEEKLASLPFSNNIITYEVEERYQECHPGGRREADICFDRKRKVTKQRTETAPLRLLDLAVSGSKEPILGPVKYTDFPTDLIGSSQDNLNCCKQIYL